jgi:hypothetical protein
MPRNSLSALEVLLRQVKADPELDDRPEVRANLLSRIRGLQRLAPDQDEQDLDVAAVLIRRDLLIGAAAVTPEGMNLRVRQSEQLLKLRSARRRMRGGPFSSRGRGRAPGGSLWARSDSPEDEDTNRDEIVESRPPTAAGGTDGID